LVLSGFFGVFGFDEGFQVREVEFPEAAVLVDPGIDGAERLGIKPVDAMAAFAVLAHQVCAAKQPEVLRDCWTRNWEGLGNFSRGLAASA
jgi:hypothetical protein